MAIKSVAVAAGLLGLAAAHGGHGHQHAHNKRGADGVYTSWDITTQWEYVTVTAGQEQAQASAHGPASVGHAAPSSSAAQAAPLSSSAAQAAPSSSSVAEAAPSSDEVQAAAVTTAATAGGAIASVNAANAAQASINSAQNAANLAHQSSMQALQASIGGGSAPAAAPTHPVESSSVIASSSAAAAPSQSAGGSTGDSGKTCTETHMTYYSGGGNFGSCGDPVYDSNNTVAMPETFMKQSCGKSIDIYVNGGTVPHRAIVADTCPGCSDGHVDVVQDWATQIAGQVILDKGKLPIKYCWTN